MGPTATGKTDLALSLAKKFNGELIACDSRQVYRNLDIGTGKYPGEYKEVIKGNGYWEIDQVKVWMYDVADLSNRYAVYDYEKNAALVVDEIRKRDKLPIVVGGTGLYLKAVLEGLPNLEIPVDEELRSALQRLSKPEMQKKLQELSFPAWQGMNGSDRQNPRRLMRAIELIAAKPNQLGNKKPGLKNYNLLKIGLTAPREILKGKIDGRALEWIKNGIVKEVDDLLKAGISKKRITELGLEYAIIVEYLDKNISFDQMIEKIQTKVRQYAKRQMTWFKKEKNIFWFDVTGKNTQGNIEKQVAKWYDNR